MTKIIAHRGASYAAPENTLASVQLAWDFQADGAEVDVRLSGDGRVVVIHDATTGRTTQLDHAVNALSLEELATLDAAHHRRPRWTGPPEPPPALAAVLATIPEGRELLIELKDGPELLGPLSVDLEYALRGGLQTGQIKLITFSFELAAAAKERFPRLDVLHIFGDYASLPDAAWPEFRANLIRQAQAARLDGLDLRADPAYVDAACVRAIHAAGLQAYIWTCNDPLTGQHFLDIGIDGITTDVPDWMRVLRGSGE